MNVVCCIGRGPCDEMITRPEESYRLWCVVVCSRKLVKEEAMAHWGLLLQSQNKIFVMVNIY